MLRSSKLGLQVFLSSLGPLFLEEKEMTKKPRNNLELVNLWRILQIVINVCNFVSAYIS
jgi:hypothetical protein